MIIYANDTRTTMNIIKIVLYQDRVPVVIGRVFSPSALMEFPKKLTKSRNLF